MDLGAIALHLRNHGALFAGQVFGAADLATAADHAPSGKANAPTAFVVPLAERAAANDYDSGVIQEITHSFAVLVVFEPGKHTALGKPGWDRVAPARAAVFRCLLGWTPPGASGPLVYAGGELHELSRARMAYRFEFEMTADISAEHDGWQPDALPPFELAHVDGLLKPGDDQADASDDVEIPQD